jgi:hypothetical protein
MYPSGVWRGFWEQKSLGRQPMAAFRLEFSAGKIAGSGVDVVGPFKFAGTYDAASGEVRMVKRYLGKHTVTYAGQPDGEGSILGTWEVSTEFAGMSFTDRGPFLMSPELPRPTGDEPIVEI